MWHTRKQPPKPLSPGTTTEELERRFAQALIRDERQDLGSTMAQALIRDEQRAEAYERQRWLMLALEMCGQAEPEEMIRRAEALRAWAKAPAKSEPT